MSFPGEHESAGVADSHVAEPNNVRPLGRDVSAASQDSANLKSVANNDAAGPPRLLALWEILSVVSSALIAEWTILPFVGKNKLVGAFPVLLAFGLIFYSQRLRGETQREVGLRFDNFRETARLLALPMIVTTVLLVGAAWLLSNFQHQLLMSRARGRSVYLLPLWGVLWGLLQQYVLQAFVNRRAQLILGKGCRSCLLVACVFALLHLPNPWLTVATFAGGLVWAWAYQRAPNLYALALSHSVMTVVLIWTLPPHVLAGLRVGFNYFT